MPLLLREIRRSRWYTQGWLEPGHAPADSLWDLLTEGNVLSCWLVQDDRGNFERVVAAISSKGERPENFDYALVPLDAVQDARIRVERTDSDTFDDEANHNWHVHLPELTAAKVSELARLIMPSDRRGRIPHKQVAGWMKQAVWDHHLRMDDLRDTMRQKLLPLE